MTESATIAELPTTRPTMQYNTQHVYGQPANDPAAMYDQPADNASGSSLELPLAAPQPQKDSLSVPYHPFQDPSTSRYHHGYASLPSSIEGQYSSTATYSPPGQEPLELHHAMELRTSGFVGSDITMGSTVENTFRHIVEPYLQYS